MSVFFVKMHGLGNDFIVIDSAAAKITPEFAREICDRRFGVGADQLLWLKKPNDTKADLRMEIFNADGSTAEMCGNGIRAVALYWAKKTSPKKCYKIETIAGTLEVKLEGENVTVDMGIPKVAIKEEALHLSGEVAQFPFHEVNVGNPHAVIFVKDVKSHPVEKLGPQIETHSRFPNRTNVEFVQVLDPHSIRIRVWERGAGITLACGTGACAAAAASIATGKVKSPLKVELPGGTLELSWAGQGQPIYMKGPATEVFRGEYSPRTQ